MITINKQLNISENYILYGIDFYIENITIDITKKYSNTSDDIIIFAKTDFKNANKIINLLENYSDFEINLNFIKLKNTIIVDYFFNTNGNIDVKFMTNDYIFDDNKYDNIMKKNHRKKILDKI